MPEFRAPRIRAKDPLANKDGTPANAFVRFWDTFCKTLEGVIRRQDQTDIDLQDQIDRLSRTLNGTENFTGIQVGGQNVKTFLDQTDGTKIINTAGLGTSVVQTAKVSPNAITNEASANTAAQLNLSTSFTVIQTVTYATTGGPLEVKANFFMDIWHPSGSGGIEARVRITRTGVGNIFDKITDAIGGDFLQGWQTPTIIEAPAAGTYTWDVIVSVSNNGFSHAFVDSRFLSVREFKR